MSEVGYLSSTIRRHGGNAALRAGPDDQDALGVPLKFSFQTEMPGGFGPGDLVLRRPRNWTIFDTELLAEVDTDDRHGSRVHEGRIVGTPRTGVNEITLELEGFSKHSEDRTDAAVIFADRDLGAWQPMPMNLRPSYLSEPPYEFTLFDPVVDHDPLIGRPSLKLAVSGIGLVTSPPWGGECFALYDAGSAARIGMVAVIRLNGALGDLSGSVYYTASLALNDDDMWGLSGYEQTGDIFSSGGAGPAYHSLSTSASTRRFAYIEWWTSDGGDWKEQEWPTWFWPVVYGNHGLTLRGSDNTSTKDLRGLYVKDMLTYIAQTWCPKWRLDAHSFDSGITEFVVPHASFKDRAMPRTMIESLLLFGGGQTYPLDWGVYDQRTAFFRSPGTYGKRWELREDAGMEPTDQGPDVAERLNATYVEYNPGDGKIRTVGPTEAIPGVAVNSNFDDYSSGLAITDPNHPATKAGDLRIDKPPVTPITNLAGATLLGQLYLFEKNRNEWRGSVNHRGDAMHYPRSPSPTGDIQSASAGPEPPYMIRAGDEFIDAGEQRATPAVGRRIIGTSWDSGTPNQVQATVGATPDHFDVYIARLAATMQAKALA